MGTAITGGPSLFGKRLLIKMENEVTVKTVHKAS
jgi:hypothetical protein